MKTSVPFLSRILAVLAISAAFAALPVAARADASPAPQTPTGELVRVNDKTDAAWLAQARAAYPLDSCSVSGDKLDSGDMGKPQDFVYRQAGKPDRLVRFCCKDCLRDFKKDPAKYLKIIDDAAAAKARAGKK